MRRIITALCLLALPVLADVPFIRIDVNFQKDSTETQWHLQIKQGNTTPIRAYLWQGADAWTATGWTAIFKYSKSDSSSPMVTLTGVVSGATVDFTPGTNTFALPLEKWYSTVLLISNVTYNSQGSGLLTVRRAPEMSPGSLIYSATIIGQQFSFSGSFSNWPFISIAGSNGNTIASTYGDVIWYTGTNWTSIGRGLAGTYLQTATSSNAPKWSFPAGDMNKLTYDPGSVQLPVVFTNNSTLIISASTNFVQTATNNVMSSVGNTYLPITSTSGWEIGAHGVFVTTGTTNIFVRIADTNGWEIGAHGTFVTVGTTNIFATSSQVFWLDGRYAGNRSVWGSGLNITNIDVTADGASQHGQNSGTMLIKPYAYGASQYGENQGIMIIGDSAQGSSQRGVAGASAGVMIIADNAIGSSQYGWNYRGIVTNDGAHGVLQLFYLTTGQTSLVTSAGSGSIILGAGIASNKNSITAGDGQISHGDGSVSASGGFFDNGSRACTNNGTYTFSGSIDRATTVTGGQSNTISTALQPGNTNNWEIGAHGVFVTTGTTNIFVRIADTNGWEIGAHGTFVTVGTTNIFVTGTDTNGWVISSHGTFVTTGTTNIFVTALDTNGWNLVVPATTNTFLAAGATNLMFKKDGSIVATGNFNHGGYSSTNLSSILFPSSLSAFFLGNNAMEYGIQIGNEGTMSISHTNNVTLQGGNTIVKITSASVDFNYGGSAINLTNGTLRGLADRATTVTGGQSNTLSTAYSWVNGNSNGVASLFSRSNTWDSTASTVSSMPTNDWNTAYGWVNGNSNGVASLFSRSNAWDSAASTVQSTLDAVYTNNSTFSLAASQVTTNFALTGLTWNTPEIIRGRLYISATNVIPFSQTATLTFREREARTAGAAIWQANMGLSAVWLASNVVVGATNVWVADSTDFAANNLVYLTGTTNEFVRVLSISGNNLILKYATTASHVDANTDIAARVREFGGFGLYDSSGSKTIWGSVDLTTATNATIKMDIEYTK